MRPAFTEAICTAKHLYYVLGLHYLYKKLERKLEILDEVDVEVCIKLFVRCQIFYKIKQQLTDVLMLIEWHGKLSEFV